MPGRGPLALGHPGPDLLKSISTSISPKAPDKDLELDSKTAILPETGQKRPRTRSSLLRLPEITAGSSPASKRKGKPRKNGKRAAKEGTPVIDLSTETSTPNLSFQSEQPLLKNKEISTSSLAQVPSADNEDALGTSLAEHPKFGSSSAIYSAISTVDLLDAGNMPHLLHPATLANTCKRPEPSFELNSSPIKNSHAPANGSSHNSAVAILLSSPTKKRKSVAFSDNLASDIGDEMPVLDAEPQIHTPRRSILKSTYVYELHTSPLDPSNSSTWVKSPHASNLNHFPSNPLFWQPGTIVQLEKNSKDLPQLVEGCIDVLSDANFHKKFEVYASLNLICKVNETATITDLFLGEDSPWLSSVENATGFKRTNAGEYIKSLCSFAHRDIALLEASLFMKTERPKLGTSSNNPFDSRVLNQVLKFIANLLAVPLLNQAISVSDMKSFYSHTCDILVKPNIPKSLVAPYLSIIKDCQISPKRRKLVFESAPEPLLEKLLFALLNMRNFVSSSLINEKFVALRNLIQNFPTVLSKNFHHWFPGFILNLCDLSFVLYAKVIGTGVTTLLEAARSYLDSPDVCLYTRRVLEAPLPMDLKSWMSENLISVNSCIQTKTIDYVVGNLKELIRNGHFKQAMDIWVGLTLLLGNVPNGLDKWNHLGDWLQVHKLCFNEKSINAKEEALSSWKVVVYKVCFLELPEVRALMPISINSPHKMNNSTKMKATPNWEALLWPKIKLLIHPFMSINKTEIRSEIIESLHRLFLSILYGLFNFQQKSSAKLFQMCWENLVSPVLLNFYFKKNTSTEQMHKLGNEILLGLLKALNPSVDKFSNTLRCLLNEPLAISEINPFNSRWLHQRFETVLPILELAFELTHLSLDTKLSTFNAFIGLLKPIVKKEVVPSDASFDLVKELPNVLERILLTHDLSYGATYKLLVNLIDAFGAPNLVPNSASTKSVFAVILKHATKNTSAQDLTVIMNMLYGAVGEKRSLLFLLILTEVNIDARKEAIAVFIGDCLNSKRTDNFLIPEMIIISNIFRTLDQNFSGIAKRLIQQLVLLKPIEYESLVLQLQISRWSSNIIHFFLVLMQDAPHEHLKLSCHKLIEEKLDDPRMTETILTYILEQGATKELLSLNDKIMTKLKPLLLSNSPFKQLWTKYIRELSDDNASLDQILLSALRQGINVEDVINDRWDDLPQFRAEWILKYGLDCSESSTSGTYPIVSEKLDSMLEKEFLMALEQHPKIQEVEKELIDDSISTESLQLSSSDEPEKIDSADSEDHEKKKMKERVGVAGSCENDNCNRIVILSEDDSVLKKEDNERIDDSVDESLSGTAGYSSQEKDEYEKEKPIREVLEVAALSRVFAKRQFDEPERELRKKTCLDLERKTGEKDLDSLHENELRIEVVSSLEGKSEKSAQDELSLVLLPDSLESEKSQSSLEKSSAVVLRLSSPLARLSSALKEISEMDLATLNRESQYELETEMMELMLRMRKRC